MNLTEALAEVDRLRAIIADHNTEVANDCASRREHGSCSRRDLPSPDEGGRKCGDCPRHYDVEGV
jgi:hypothetical protein